MNATFENDAILFVNDAHGVYIPQIFAQSIKREYVQGVNAEDWAILEDGPDNEEYWDTWIYVEDNARVTNPENGITYTVYQNGDCFLVPEDCEIPEW